MDRRLGRPLPHQLPNPTRADPSPINLSQYHLSTKRRIRHYSRFPRAIPEERARSHALLTRPPLTPKGPLDLHVLSLPPAFVLSQDQTLKLKRVPKTVLDVRTSAHRSSLPARAQTSSFAVHPFPLETDVRQTVKLTPTSSGHTPSEPICKQSVHRNEPNRPHIPSSDNTVKERSDQTQPIAPPWWRNKLPEPLIYRPAEVAPGSRGAAR